MTVTVHRTTGAPLTGALLDEAQPGVISLQVTETERVAIPAVRIARVEVVR